MPSFAKILVGELLGTFALVLFGCGAVLGAVLFGSHASLFQVGLVWGIGVALAILLSRQLSGAHLNPAVTVGLAVAGATPWRTVPVYLVVQAIGAALAALLLLGLYEPSIAAYEATQGIVRGSSASVATAKMFGEFYPNPGSGAVAGLGVAFAAETVGTGLLMLVILCFTHPHIAGRPSADLLPWAIGLTVASLIWLLAPLTQAGLNRHATSFCA